MEYENNQRKFESVYSTKVRAGKRRTYFFDVRKTKGDDFYITLTESTKRFDGDGYERHKIFLYKEDFNRFLTSLGDAINHVKTELMPDYDYDEFTRRQEEWEIKRAAMDLEAAAAEASDASPKPAADTQVEATGVEAVTQEADTTDDTTDEVPSSMVAEEVPEPVTSEIDATPESSETATPDVTSEDALPSPVSEKINEVSTETDEEDMSW